MVLFTSELFFESNESYHQDAYDTIYFDPLNKSYSCYQNVKIAIIDVGITDQEHLSFQKYRLSSSPTTNPHGNKVANLLASQTDPKTGFQGLLPNLSLYGYSLAAEELTIPCLVKAIETVTSWNVDIINISLGTEVDDPRIKNAISQAINSGIVVVCSAGNTPYQNNYPAAYNIKGLLSVGSINREYQVLEGSNGTNVDLFAPGENILSLDPNAGIISCSGTSFSVPFVTMACAYIKGCYPNISPADIEELLLDTAHRYQGTWRVHQLEIALLDMNSLCSHLSTNKNQF